MHFAIKFERCRKIISRHLNLILYNFVPVRLSLFDCYRHHRASGLVILIAASFHRDLVGSGLAAPRHRDFSFLCHLNAGLLCGFVQCIGYLSLSSILFLLKPCKLDTFPLSFPRFRTRRIHQNSVRWIRTNTLILYANRMNRT